MTRFLVLGLLFWLPRDKKIRIDRWLRGREEFRKLKQADGVIVSFGKSGRTWLRVMLSRFYQVKHGLGERHLIGFDNLHRKNRAIPRLFFTHDNYLKDYTGNRDSKADFYDKKVVLLVRNPLDVAVSQFFQWQYRMRPNKKFINDYPAHGADIDAWDFVLDKDAGVPRIVDYFNGWAQFSPNESELLLIRYEDMRKDPVAIMRQVFEFVGTPGTDEQVEQGAGWRIPGGRLDAGLVPGGHGPAPGHARLVQQQLDLARRLLDAVRPLAERVGEIGPHKALDLQALGREEGQGQGPLVVDLVLGVAVDDHAQALFDLLLDLHRRASRAV